MQRKIQYIKGSYYVNIPKHIVEKLEFFARKPVEVIFNENTGHAEVF